jgi:pyruvate dehydrogenase E2 component (dihydrolipoamide acetyltransferase)
MEEIFVPASGMAMEDVLFSEWLKQPGQEVAPGEVVAVVETDKSVVELSGTVAGRLSRHLVQAGARVPGGTTVAYLLENGEEEPSVPATGVAAPTASAPSVAAAPSAPTTEARPDGRHKLSPRQRREMEEAALSPSAVAPLDVAAGPPASPGVLPEGAQDSQTALVGGPSSNRQATAALVSQSWREIPHFSVGREVAVGGLLEAVARAKATGLPATATDFLLLALSRALVLQGEPPDVGLAVATDWGVLIPVVRPGVAGSLADVTTLRQGAVGRARIRRLGSADAAPVFATLSNLGPTGVSWFTGVVPVGQVALVTVGEVSLRPAVEEGKLVVSPMLTVVVTADHRHYDGTDSARLLSAFVGCLRAVVAGVPA